MGAAAKKRGKMIPPGNLPAQASAMASSLATPTCIAAEAEANGTLGSTLAAAVSALSSPCFVAENAVACPSIAVWRLPSPQNMVCGKDMLSNPTHIPMSVLVGLVWIFSGDSIIDPSRHELVCEM